MSEARAPFDTRYCFASNEDGDRHLIVDAADADMTGWRLKVTDPDGIVDESQFEAATLWGAPGRLNFLAIGERRPAWAVLSQWGTRTAVVVDPDGREYGVFSQ